MMDKMEFMPNEIAILSDKAGIDLPMRAGSRVLILGKSDFKNFEYDVEFDDHTTSPVKESELIKMNDEIKYYMDYIFIGNKVLSKLIGETVHIEKVDYMNKKVEIKFEDGSYTVTDFNDLEPLHIDSLEDISVSNSERYKQLLQEKYNVYVRKNADYGNSFEDQFNEYGLLSAIIRLDDKLRRLKQLRNGDAKVKDESIRDTALDMANYADMLVMALDKSK